MKVYIMVDFEGIAGFLEWDEHADNTPMGQAKRHRLRTFLTNEVNAAATACFASGADEVLVWDSHGPRANCNHIYIEGLHPETQIIQGWKGLPSFYPQLDGSFDAGLYVGMHAMEDTPHAVTPHTKTILNGHALGEGGMFLAMCAYFQVPVVFVSGDAAAIDQVLAQVPQMESVKTKWAFGPYAARTRTPAKACELIAVGVAKALARRAEIPCWNLPKPYVFTRDDGSLLQGNDLFELYKRMLDDCKWDDQSLEPQLRLVRDRARAAPLNYKDTE
jgi:D-amino peptidase